MRLHRYIKEHPYIIKHSILVTNWIKDGLVKVNGVVATKNTRMSVHYDTVEVYLNSVWVTLEYTNTNREVLALYKPIQYLTTFYDPLSRRCLKDLLPPQYQTLRYAGRLDYMSEGLLLLSDDGQYIYKHTHPSMKCTKVYLVGLKAPLSNQFFEHAQSGHFQINYDERVEVLKSVKVYPALLQDIDEYTFLDLDTTQYWYIFKLTEGKKNQIRKMCLRYYNPVQRLIRIKHGAIKLTKHIATSGFVEIPYDNQGVR